MSWQLSLSLLFAVVYSASLPAAEPVELLSYNIRYLNKSDGEDVWGKRSSKVIETIAASDIAGLQEVVSEQLSDIQTATTDFQWYGKGRDDGDQKGEMTPIGWRTALFTCEEQGTFWLSEHPDIVGVKGWDAALPRVASWVKLQRKTDGAMILVVNTHFDHVGREARRNSARLLRSWIATHRGELPAVLLGDLNAELQDAPLVELLDVAKQEGVEPLVDTRTTTATEPVGPNSTWNGFREIADGRRIDHVLFAGKIEVTKYETLNPKTEAGRFASDHLPIMVTMNW